MKKSVVICLLVLTAGLPVSGYQARQTKQERIKQELMQLERDIGQAEIKRDIAFFERLYADELVFTLENGALITKRQDIEGWKTAPSDFKVLTYDVDEMEALLYDKVAVVRGRIVENRQAKGKTWTRRTRFTDTFVWRAGRWQLAAAHLSSLPKPQTQP